MRTSLELPQGMIDNEARELAQRAGEGKPPMAFEPFVPSARRRVAGGVLLAEIARQNDIRIDSRRASRRAVGDRLDLRGTRPGR